MREGRQRLAVAGIFALFYYYSAFVCDDAFITFRSIDHFVRGYGLRWNVAERVQVFTSPLFAALFTGPYALVFDPDAAPNPDRPYWLAIALSFVLSVALLWRLFSIWRGRPVFWALFAVLLASQAFVTFTSSGLETPLCFLVIVWFFAAWLKGDPPNARGYVAQFLCAALVLLSRLDLLLLIGPAAVALVVTGWRTLGRGIVKPIAIGLVPVAGWHLFSIAYFGFLLPNSYYAKLGIDAPPAIVWSLGRYYFAECLRQDPITMVVSAAALAVCWTNRRTLVAGAGVALYLVYVCSIGGDFIGFRFLATPFLVSVMILADRLDAWTALMPTWWWKAVVAGALVYSFAVPSSPLRAMREGPKAPDVAYYYPGSGLARWRVGAHVPFAPFLNVDGREDCRRLYASQPAASTGGDGLPGFCRGPNAFLIDPHGITDPLIARLAVPVAGKFKPAHIRKAVPVGYVESAESGLNRIADPGVAVFYGELRAVVAGPLWTLDRWRSIWRLNFTSAARYRRPYS